MRLPLLLDVRLGFKLNVIRHRRAYGASSSRIGATRLVKAGELDRFDTRRAIMAFEFDLNALGVFQIIDDNLSGLLCAHSNSVSVSTE